jgi:hypothetical protein
MTEEESTKLTMEDRKAVLRGIFELAKWLIATLFLLNGAAALAVLSRTDLDPLIVANIALYFSNGVLASITSATAMMMALFASYGTLMEALRGSARRAVWAPFFLFVQLAGASIALASAAFSVSYFVAGVKTWAEVSIAKGEERIRQAQIERARPHAADTQVAKQSAK